MVSLPPDSESRHPFARVALAIPVPELFDYRVPTELEEAVVPGARVRVPFGRGVRIGYCIERSAEQRYEKLKEIEAVVDDAPLLEPDLLNLVKWTADYYLCSVGEVIEAAVPKGVRDGKKRAIRWVKLSSPPANAAEKETPVPIDRGPGSVQRQEILRVLEEMGGALPLSELLKLASSGESSVKTLERRGRLEILRAPPPEFGGLANVSPTTSELSAWRTPPPYQLTSEQQAAVSAIDAEITRSQFSALLLEGVTGSGKTEVYLHAIRTALSLGKGALVLLPEISLTPQTVERFRERLGDVAVLHSLLSPTERSMHYGRLRRREIRVAIGARSAIFAPIPELGLIVVDECHEESYKQEKAPRYHARDLSVVRASQLEIPVILGSATPSLESLENVARGRFKGLKLPNRVTGHQRAAVEIVDRRTEPTEAGPPQLLGPKLLLRLREAIDREEQALLFLNRRGFARRIHCPRCGFHLECPECDIALTYHKRSDRSLCHYCGSIRSVPESCPDCAFPGVRRTLAGTERIEETLAKLFPGLPIGRLDRDTATSAGRMEEILAKFRGGETRILIGTQMIAKGHDIPGVTLVGVIDADVALGLPDFRAAERTAQILCQVAGRAGRGDRPGRVVIQTRQPEHYALQAAQLQDLELLREREAPLRKLLMYPPYGYLSRILCEDTSEQRSLQTAEDLRKQLDQNRAGTVKVLGPAPAPLAKLRGRYRYHILLKARDRAALHRTASRVAWAKARWSSTKVIVDIDPTSLM